MRYSEYLAYLQSSEWKAVRRRFYQSGLYDGGCFCCGQRGIQLQIHHRTYRRLGHEKLHDLCAVCDGCHVLIHTMLKEGSGISLFRMANRLRRKVNKKGKRWIDAKRKGMGLS